jgi:tetratricopeptide (TPR) repeat protein
VKKIAKKKSAPKREITKTAAPLRAKNGAPPNPSPLSYIAASELPEAKNQYSQFERATQLFHKGSFKQAKELFLKSAIGPSREVAANAKSHVRMCERRLAAPPPAPKSAEDHYTYAVALLNARKPLEARPHIQAALRQQPEADHLHYALAVSLVLSGEVSGAYDSLKRAIELQPRNRNIARQDPDFERYSDQPPIDGLLYP